MKKCAIIIKDKIDNINVYDYDLLIGVESGSRFVYEYKDELNTFHISDLDSLDQEWKDKISSLSNSIILDHNTKDFADGEEAIRYALKNNYDGSNIDLYVDFDYRQDHFLNMFFILRKYGCNLINDNIIINVVQPNIKTTIKKQYDLLSAFIFEDTFVKTNGLKWNVDEMLDIDSGTKFISNEILENEFDITVDKKIIITQSKK